MSVVITSNQSSGRIEFLNEETEKFIKKAKEFSIHKGRSIVHVRDKIEKESPELSTKEKYEKVAEHVFNIFKTGNYKKAISQLQNMEKGEIQSFEIKLKNTHLNFKNIFLDDRSLSTVQEHCNQRTIDVFKRIHDTLSYNNLNGYEKLKLTLKKLQDKEKISKYALDQAFNVAKYALTYDFSNGNDNCFLWIICGSDQSTATKRSYLFDYIRVFGRNDPRLVKLANVAFEHTKAKQEYNKKLRKYNEMLSSYTSRELYKPKSDSKIYEVIANLKFTETSITNHRSTEYFSKEDVEEVGEICLTDNLSTKGIGPFCGISIARDLHNNEKWVLNIHPGLNPTVLMDVDGLKIVMEEVLEKLNILRPPLSNFINLVLKRYDKYDAYSEIKKAFMEWQLDISSQCTAKEHI